MTQGEARGQNLLNVQLYFSDLCSYFTDHLLESFHIWKFGTIHGTLILDNFRHLGPCLRVGLEVKLKDICFLESFVFEQVVSL